MNINFEKAITQFPGRVIEIIEDNVKKYETDRDEITFKINSICSGKLSHSVIDAISCCLGTFIFDCCQEKEEREKLYASTIEKIRDVILRCDGFRIRR